MQLTDLNDDCLVYIATFLDVISRSNLSATCQQVKSACWTNYAWKSVRATVKNPVDAEGFLQFLRTSKTSGINKVCVRILDKFECLPGGAANNPAIPSVRILSVVFETDDLQVQIAAVACLNLIFPGVENLTLKRLELKYNDDVVPASVENKWALKHLSFETGSLHTFFVYGCHGLLRLMQHQYLEVLHVKIYAESRSGSTLHYGTYVWLDEVLNICQKSLKEVVFEYCWSNKIHMCDALKTLRINCFSIDMSRIISEVPSAVETLMLRGLVILRPTIQGQERRLKTLKSFTIELAIVPINEIEQLCFYIVATFPNVESLNFSTRFGLEVGFSDSAFAGLAVLKKLKVLRIKGIKDLKGTFLHRHFPGLQRLEVEDCPKFDVVSARGLAQKQGGTINIVVS